MPMDDSTIMPTPHPLLGQLSAQQFLDQYWQQKPLLIRQAIANFEPLFTAEELAGMSCEEGIESRLIQENGPRGSWQCDSGPFTDDDYRALPESHWTLLVQAVDLWVPEAAALLRQFDFLPQWRRDDLMISYATDGGSVGPHYDQYDVFLLQAEGQRQWQIGQWCNDLSELLPDGDLRILKDFDEQDSWILEPGDMLYLPPQLAHYGRSIGQCMTYSIGFRAPSKRQLLERLVDNISPKLAEDDRYTDAGRPLVYEQGQIDSSAINSVKDLLLDAIGDPAVLGELLGTLTTEAKYDELSRKPECEISHNEFEQLIENDFHRNPTRRFAYHVLNDDIQFFVDGDCYLRPSSELPLIRYLANHSQYRATQVVTYIVSEECRNFLIELFENDDFMTSL